MGGRGGSSGMKSGGSKVGTYRINLSALPKLEGTEKQVSWANSIRETAVGTINSNLERLEQFSKRGPGFARSVEPQLRAFEKAGKELSTALGQMKKASDIIDKRNVLSGRTILEIVNEYERRAK